MTNQKKNYHHGDLISSLIKAASDILQEEGVEGLSMRKLADKVGVSRTAPYHHFKDKNALLCAIAEAGFKAQEARLASLLSSHEEAEQRFRLYVHQYIEFADTQREVYDLMYGRLIWKTGTPTNSLKAASKQTFKRWLDWVEQLQADNVLPNNNSALRVGQASWASLHGLSRLLIDGIYLDRNDIQAMIEQMIQTLIKAQPASS
ncbi:TetR/AcrR family transcriptional regulator [Marinomonas pollencensis]|uniref:TetR family transcriptional regulator n=1 Tax=Marinomonas pollencensis TaxID=491954 RepID=A0A3E0DHR5_9GAMM|nr:TetR/AcrR family transcriptional regulator [Marinomonas pollencensis]REG82248.1 TetR family transcriptional regulator [Marinomonas pollencensis]